MERFRISIPLEQIDDLRARLRSARWPDSVSNSGWAYGGDLNYMQELREYWLTRFDWGWQEEGMNQFAHFKQNVDGLKIHFIHERGEGANPLPLLITHGWPGSFLEFLQIIPMLTHPSRFGGRPEDSFDVIAPSLVGFGFSERSTRPGCNVIQVAKLWDKLMTSLGYSTYVAQGGDIGASVSTRLAMLYPNRVKAIHLNYIPGSYQPYLEQDNRTAGEREFAQMVDEWLQKHGAYSHVQRNEPQTLGIALNDSPMGLAAWLVTKFREWSDCDGDVEKRFSKDALLSNISLYWFTQTITSSVRMYYENKLAPLQLARGERITVPCAVARFPIESPFPPREWVERAYNVVRWTEMPRGGHFAAAEEPALLADDLRSSFRDFRG